MSPIFQPADDFHCFDGLETVLLRSRDAASPVAVAGALRRRMESREAEASDGRYLADDVVWHLPSAELAAPPQVGSVMIDSSGAEYRVLRVERTTLGARWVCHSRSLSIGGNLDRLITIQRATWTKDSHGVATPHWSVVRSDLAARIQPQVGKIGLEQDRRQTRVTHRVYLAERVAVHQDDRIVADGCVYRVLGFEQTERLDSLPCVLTERVDGALGFFHDDAGPGAL